MIKFISYWNKKTINCRKGIACEDPSCTATVVKSRIMFHEFMDKLYFVTGYDKQYTCLAVIYRYPILKQYRMLPITDQGTIKIASVVVAPRESLKLCMATNAENLPHRSPLPSNNNPSFRGMEASHATESSSASNSKLSHNSIKSIPLDDFKDDQRCQASPQRPFL